MQTRIVKTKVWTDPKVLEFTVEARFLFLYLLSCPSIGLSGIFECPEKLILLHTGLSQKDLQNARDHLSQKGCAHFVNDWIWVVNAQKHNNYRQSKGIESAFQRELAFVPEEIMKSFESRGYSTPPSTHKPKIKNNKPKNKGGVEKPFV